MTDNNTETTALILAGDGYQLTIAPEAEVRKAELLSASGKIGCVNDNDESGRAQFVTRNLAAMRIEVEKSRKLVKEPVNRIGKLIDSTAKNFLMELEAEEKRIGKLVGDHAMEVARAKAEKEAAERRAFEEARRAREEAERAAAAAEEARENKASITEVLAARKAAEAAEAERQASLAARMEASAEVAGTKVAQGVRFAWDFEVVDIMDMVQFAIDLVELTPRRALILQRIKECAEIHGNDAKVAEIYAAIGIRAFKKPVVSSR